MASNRQAKTKPANLTINPQPERPMAKSEDTPPPASATSAMDLQGIDLSSFGGDFSTPLITLPALPQSPPTSPRIGKESQKGFLNFKNRLNSEQEQRAEPPQKRLVKDDDDYRPTSSSVSKIYHLRKNPGSTPELSLVGSAEAERKQSDDVTIAPTPDPRQLSQSLPQPTEEATIAKRREKGGFRNPLRSKSIRRDSNSKSSKPNKPSFDQQPPKTAPLNADWQASSEMLLKPHKKEKRGKSAERAPVASESEDNLPMDRSAQAKEKDRGGFVSNSKNVMNKAKTGGGNILSRLGKLGRTGSNHEKETVSDSEYVIKVINLPLVEQTRVTRISKDLSRCRDKTEYWMPSLPWRCIDYLNLNCESEGLYRVPGSGPQVKHWQRRFDTELDLDLLDEEELYDPNIISSMLKSWLRDLPTEIMPKTLQASLADALAKENPNYQRIGEPAPQILRDRLSELPPFNYYLLFAITCHLSLLLSHKEKNKMDLNNLSICIGPCLELDRWLFNYLVGDWRRCWQGCYTEKQFLEAEKAFEMGGEYEVPDLARGRQEDGEKSNNTEEVKTPVTAVPVDEKSTKEASSTQGSRSGSTQDSSNDKPLPTPKSSPPLPSPPATQSTTNPNENVKPDTSLSSLPDYSNYINGSIPPTPDRKALFAAVDTRRPSTAQGTGVESPKVGGGASPSVGVEGERRKLSSHSRTQSELSPTVGQSAASTTSQLSPIQTTSPIELDLPFRKGSE